MLCCVAVVIPVTVVVTLLLSQALPLPDPSASTGERSPFCDEPDPELRRVAEFVYWCATGVLTIGVASLPEFWAALDRVKRCWSAPRVETATATTHQVRGRKREIPPYHGQERAPPHGRMHPR